MHAYSQRCQWFWLATSAIWKTNELLGGTKVKTYPGNGEIGMFTTLYYEYMHVHVYSKKKLPFIPFPL